ncbi:hypothetical protein ABR763_01200 [Bacillus cereus]
MSKITCTVYPDKDYLDFNTNSMISDGVVDLQVTQDDNTNVVSLDVKRMKKLRKQLKKYIRAIEEENE